MSLISLMPLQAALPSVGPAARREQPSASGGSPPSPQRSPDDFEGRLRDLGCEWVGASRLRGTEDTPVEAVLRVLDEMDAETPIMLVLPAQHIEIMRSAHGTQSLWSRPAPLYDVDAEPAAEPAAASAAAAESGRLRSLPVRDSRPIVGRRGSVDRVPPLRLSRVAGGVLVASARCRSATADPSSVVADRSIACHRFDSRAWQVASSSRTPTTRFEVDLPVGKRRWHRRLRRDHRRGRRERRQRRV